MKNDLDEMRQRLVSLEREVTQLKAQVAHCGRGNDPRPWWERISGRFENDPVFAEIIRLGRKIRKADKPRSKAGARR